MKTHEQHTEDLENGKEWGLFLWLTAMNHLVVIFISNRIFLI